MKTNRFLWVVLLCLVLIPGFATCSETPSIPANEALQRLMDGNGRYVSAKLAHPNQTEQCRMEVAKGQRPFVIILGCSDSRVPPEILFDQGIGDLFVIRLAGNIVDDAAIGSIEYAADHLGVRLVMVLGHTKCGAVSAAVQGGETHGHISKLVEIIRPAVEEAKGQQGDLLDNAVVSNVKLVAGKLETSQPILAELVKKGNLKIIGARYNLDSGKVDIVRQ